MIRGLLRNMMIAAAVALAAVRAFRTPLSTPRSADWQSKLRRALKQRLIEYPIVFAILGVGGFLVAASGIIPIGASSGHWPITRWLLIFSMSRSVSTHTVGMDLPLLDDPTLVMKGAGAYETACRPCHGSPDLPHPRIAGAMLPQPPYLPPKIADWSPAELFYLVKHGVKFTGMPAWPAQRRDDEVWAVTAFLLQFPKIDAQTYAQLVHGPRPLPPLQSLAGPVPSQAVIATCARCHGLDGRGRGLGAFPQLAGQRPLYLFNALRAFSRAERHSGMMEPIAAALSEEQMRAVALHYSRSHPMPLKITRRLDAAIDRGRMIARHGIPGQDVPACAHCHGPAPARKNDAYPLLAGQYADYLFLQLQLFQQQRRGGSRYAHLMRRAAAGLEPGQMRDVALYYESLSP